MNFSKLSNCHVFEINDESSSSTSDFILHVSSSESEMDEFESQSLQLVSDEDRDTEKTNTAVEKLPSLVSDNNCFERGISSATIDVIFEGGNEDNSPSESFNFRIFEGKKVSCEPLSFNNNDNKIKALFSNNDKNEENCSSEESELDLKSFKKIRKMHVQLFSSDDSTSDKKSFADLPHRKVKRHKRGCTTRSQLRDQKKLMLRQKFEALRQKRSRAIKALIPFIDRSCSAPLKSSRSTKQQLLRNMKIFRINLIPGWK